MSLPIRRRFSLTFRIAAFGAWATLAVHACSGQDAPRIAAASTELPAFDSTGFTRIFDGKSLSGWDGDPTYWRVEAGTLVGVVTPETLLKKNSWIVYRGELVEDFELVLDYRVTEGGNSGVGYRLAVLENDPVSVRGPQADIHGADMFTGICYEENGRRLLAARGQSTRLDPDQLPRLIAQLADPAELQSVVKRNDWNRYRLLVKGHDAQHFLNGVLMSEVHDSDEPNRLPRGLLGVQVHVGPPMKIEYRDIFLKHLGPKPEGDAARGAVVYRPGSMREPQHAETFENLAKQAARISAPAAEKPLDGKTELTITTRELGIVRTDLTNVALYGGAKPLPAGKAGFDLIVMQGERTIRVPKVGDRLIGKPLDRDYQVRLEWDADARSYRLAELIEAPTGAQASDDVAARQVELKSNDRIIFFGDSLTNLAGEEKPKEHVSKGYVRIVRETLQAEHKEKNLEVDWVATGGHTVPDLLKRVEKDVIAKKPTIVVIQIGCNDARRLPIETFRSSLNELIDTLQAAGIQVVQCTLTSVGEKHDGTNKDDSKLEEFAQVEREIARSKNVPLNDLRKAFVAYWKEHNAENQPSGILTYDGNHFNQRGHDFVARQMLSKFR